MNFVEAIWQNKIIQSTLRKMTHSMKTTVLNNYTPARHAFCTRRKLEVQKFTDCSSII